MRPDTKWEELIALVETKRESAVTEWQEASDLRNEAEQRVQEAETTIAKCDAVLDVLREKQSAQTQGEPVRAPSAPMESTDSENPAVKTTRWYIRMFLKSGNNAPKTSPEITKAIMAAGALNDGTYARAKSVVDANLKRMKEAREVERKEAGWTLKGEQQLTLSSQSAESSDLSFLVISQRLVSCLAAPDGSGIGNRRFVLPITDRNLSDHSGQLHHISGTLRLLRHDRKVVGHSERIFFKLYQCQLGGFRALLGVDPPPNGSHSGDSRVVGNPRRNLLQGGVDGRELHAEFGGDLLALVVQPNQEGHFPTSGAQVIQGEGHGVPTRWRMTPCPLALRIMTVPRSPSKIWSAPRKMPPRTWP